MSQSEREKNAEIVRAAVATADLDGLDRFMAQYSRAAVVEWLLDSMPPEPRRACLQYFLLKYAAELGGAQCPV